MSMDNVQDDSESSPIAMTLDDAAEAILGNWEDADEDQLSEDTLEATDDSTEETVDESDTEEDGETEEEDESDIDPDQESDEAEDEEDAGEVEEVDLPEETLIEIIVDGQTKQASLKDLKRLYGQEASLTRKSQETASQKKLADETLQRANTSLQAMLTRAQDRYRPYEEVDMLLASRQMEPDDFAALRAEAKAAESDLRFLTEEADSFYGDLKQKEAVQVRERAKHCVEVLQKDIPNWSNDLYNDIRQHAIQSGLPEEAVNQYTDPSVIKLLHKAMMFDRTKQVAKTKKLKAPLKVLRSKKAPPSNTDIKVGKQKAAQDRLRNGPSRGGDLDDIAEAIMANWA